MGIDEPVKTPTYALKDGMIYIYSLGVLEPLTQGNAGKRLEQHRTDGAYYQRADPERSVRELELADELSDLLRLQIEGAQSA